MPPPRLATSLLRRVLPEDVRDAIDGDLRELYERRRSMSGATSARLWYWRTMLSFAVRFAPMRLSALADHLISRDRIPSALDFKLGGRMLRKHPGLTIVGGMGMAVATAIGAGAFAFVNIYLYPDLPLDEGDRVVSIVNWDARRGRADRRMLHDFVAWRAESKALVDVGAFRTTRRNVVDSAGQSSLVDVAEMSAAGFRVARIPALRGRVLLDADERPDATPVIVIGHDVWTERFQGDPDIIGRVVRLGRVPHVIVGVMPQGFAFPVHDAWWIPLRADPDAYQRGEGPRLDVFARLAPGVTREAAQAELTVISARSAPTPPEEREGLGPRVMDYVEVFAHMGATPARLVLIQTVFAMLLVLVCMNVALLVYARTVVRTGEIAVRTALGATRGRIVTQLVAEALVLSLLSACAGLALVSAGLRVVDHLRSTYEGGLPFWVEPGLSLGTVLYTLGLAFLGAMVIGVLPALRVTRRQLGATLGSLTGGGKPRLGRTWTWMIVTQVAVAVATVPPALLMGRYWVSQAMASPGFPSDEYLSADLHLERENDADDATAEFTRALWTTQTAMLERLAGDPAVAGVTFALELPGYHAYDYVGIEGPRVRTARVARIGTNYFPVFGVTLLAGRSFTDADVARTTARPVIVNRAFAEQLSAHGSVVGQRILFPVQLGGRTDRAISSREIVGVVEDFPAGRIGIDDPGDSRATLYVPIALGEEQSVTIFARMRAPLADFVPRLRAIAAAVDPTLQLRELQTVEQAYAVRRRELAMAALGVVLVVGSVLLLSAAGMYAMMSFTVSQRRREIGVRSALGGGARHILTGVLGRAALQLGIGVVAGLVLVYAADRWMAGGELLQRTGLLAVPTTALFMVAIGLIAAAGPAMYGLRIQPTEALRAE